VRVRYQGPAADTFPAWQRQGSGRAALQGRVLEWDEQQVVLAVYPPPTAAGMSRASPHPDTVRLSVNGIAAMEVRALSRSRTAAAAVGGTLVGALLVRGLFNWTRSVPTPPDTQP
jgi:hypothetical protein